MIMGETESAGFQNIRAAVLKKKRKSAGFQNIRRRGFKE